MPDSFQGVSLLLLFITAFSWSLANDDKLIINRPTSQSGTQGQVDEVTIPSALCMNHSEGLCAALDAKAIAENLPCRCVCSINESGPKGSYFSRGTFGVREGRQGCITNFEMRDMRPSGCNRRLFLQDGLKVESATDPLFILLTNQDTTLKITDHESIKANKKCRIDEDNSAFMACDGTWQYVDGDLITKRFGGTFGYTEELENVHITLKDNDHTSVLNGRVVSLGVTCLDNSESYDHYCVSLKVQGTIKCPAKMPIKRKGNRNKAQDDGSNRRKVIIACSVIGGLALIAVIIILVVLLMKRRRKVRDRLKDRTSAPKTDSAKGGPKADHLNQFCVTKTREVGLDREKAPNNTARVNLSFEHDECSMSMGNSQFYTPEEMYTEPTEHKRNTLFFPEMVQTPQHGANDCYRGLGREGYAGLCKDVDAPRTTELITNEALAIGSTEDKDPVYDVLESDPAHVENHMYGVLEGPDSNMYVEDHMYGVLESPDSNVYGTLQGTEYEKDHLYGVLQRTNTEEKQRNNEDAGGEVPEWPSEGNLTYIEFGAHSNETAEIGNSDGDLENTTPEQANMYLVLEDPRDNLNLGYDNGGELEASYSIDQPVYDILEHPNGNENLVCEGNDHEESYERREMHDHEKSAGNDGCPGNEVLEDPSPDFITELDPYNGDPEGLVIPNSECVEDHIYGNVAELYPEYLKENHDFTVSDEDHICGNLEPELGFDEE